jgi:ABC-type branched-subunit amino acid transport system substrate-binding protein
MPVHGRNAHRAPRVVATLVLLTLVAAACGSSDDKDADATSTSAPASSKFVEMTGVPGVTDTEIRFALQGTATDSNPLGECYMECFGEGARAYFAYRNSEGGIYGRDLVVMEGINDEVGNAQRTALQVIAADDAVGVFSAGLLSADYAEYNQAGWPVYTYLTDSSLGARPNIFSGFGAYTFDHPDTAHPFGPLAMKATKVAAIGYDVTAAQACVDQYKLEFEGPYKKLGISIVYTNKSLPFGLANGVGPEVTAMKNAGVDFVFTCLEAGGMKKVAEEMQRQDLKAPMFTSAQFETEFVANNASLFEGAIQMVHLRPQVATDSTGSKAFYTWMKKTGAEIHNTSYWGWVGADLAYRGLQKAGAPFDRKKIIDATNTLTGYSADGMVGAFDVGRQHQGPTPDDPASHGDVPHCYSFTQIKSGKLTFIPPATKDKPFLCWPGTTYDYSTPTPTNFG